MATGALWSRGVLLSRVEKGVQPWHWKLAKVKRASLKRKRIQPRWWKLGKVHRVTLKRGGVQPPWLWWQSLAAVPLGPEWLASLPSVDTGYVTSSDSSLLQTNSLHNRQAIHQKQNKVLVKGSSLGFLLQCYGQASSPGLLNNCMYISVHYDNQLNQSK